MPGTQGMNQVQNLEEKEKQEILRKNQGPSKHSRDKKQRGITVLFMPMAVMWGCAGEKHSEDAGRGGYWARVSCTERKQEKAPLDESSGNLCRGSKL